MFAISRFLPRNFAALQGRLIPSPAMIRAGAWFVAALVVGWVVASWFWRLAAPDAAPRIEAAPLPDYPTAAKSVVARHLMGRPSAGGDEKGGERVGVNLRLLGAMTASPERAGFAILAEDGKPSLAVVEGETFMPGYRLLKVLPGQVRVKIGERVETIEMTKTATTAGIESGEPAAVTPDGPGTRGLSARRNAGPIPNGARP